MLSTIDPLLSVSVGIPHSDPRLHTTRLPYCARLSAHSCYFLACRPAALQHRFQPQPAPTRWPQVYANDLNPASVHWLHTNARLNRVSGRLHCFNLDARAFLRMLTAAPGASTLADLQARRLQVVDDEAHCMHVQTCTW